MEKENIFSQIQVECICHFRFRKQAVHLLHEQIDRKHFIVPFLFVVLVISLEMIMFATK